MAYPSLALSNFVNGTPPMSARHTEPGHHQHVARLEGVALRSCPVSLGP